MMSRLVHAVLWLALLAGRAHAVSDGADLHVGVGQTLTLDAATPARLHVSSLQLDDNATLVIERATVALIADTARFGHHARLLVTPPPAVAGRAGTRAEGRGCDADLAGHAGTAGRDGAPGHRLSLQATIVSLGELTIDAPGGDGGEGGAGGAGGDASGDCKARPGGRGGDGGAGGHGGDGGVVELRLSLVAGLSDAAVRERITLNVPGGTPGAGGIAGRGGEGAPGHYVIQKTLVGNQKWIAGAPAGADGTPGTAGLHGRRGQATLDVVPLLDRASTAPAETIDVLRRRLDALEQEVRSLRTTLDALPSR